MIMMRKNHLTETFDIKARGVAEKFYDDSELERYADSFLQWVVIWFLACHVVGFPATCALFIACRASMWIVRKVFIESYLMNYKQKRQKDG